MYQPHIIVVPDSFFRPIDWVKDGELFAVEETACTDEVLIAPNAKENYLNVALFEFKESCMAKQERLISYCRANYFPFHAMFADEVLISYNHQYESVWYDVHDERSENNTDLEAVQDRKNWLEFKQVEHELDKRKFTLDADIVAARYWNKPIYIRESCYDVFRKLSQDYPRNLVVGELKSPGLYMDSLQETRRLLMQLPNIAGLSYNFQRVLLSRMTQDDYLSFQILASWLLNWIFVCVGGSANLFSVVPVKALLLADNYIFGHQPAIMQGLAKRRYGTDRFPIICTFKDDNHIRASLESKERLVEGIEVLSRVPEPKIEFMARKKRWLVL